MLDIKFIRDNKELVKENCKNRNVNIDIDLLLNLDNERRAGLKEVETLRALRNNKSKGKPTEEEIAKLRQVGEEISGLEKKMEDIENKYRELLYKVPNLTHPETPMGGESDFKVIHTSASPKPFKFIPKNHEELMLNLDLIDFERGAKVAAAKFYFSKNNLVRLNQALLNYGIDMLTKNGYTLVETPDVAKNEILAGVGFNPRGEETQVYSLENTDLSLIGTAEITMGGYHAQEVLDLSKGPKKYVALSHCFRTEAGAYGKTNKGLYRVHQFTKLEMFIYCKPEDSEKMHLELLSMEKKIADGLKLPYRVIEVASGDLGGPAYRKYDIEAWMVMNAENDQQGGYGEITSTSNCTDYQSRRLNIKYRKENGETEFMHTLNGTAIVTSRFPLAIVENFQQKDGSVLVPKVLQKYTGFKKL
ncbi:MAG: seryl-tRNA synthetase [Parcubacteria group bacterium Gr01-1014_13]|nr:MAG: seryl-tRNA synthetase [Parcubacteria group bacterium Gr01-1014_13]